MIAGKAREAPTCRQLSHSTVTLSSIIMPLCHEAGIKPAPRLWIALWLLRRCGSRSRGRGRRRGRNSLSCPCCRGRPGVVHVPVNQVAGTKYYGEDKEDGDHAPALPRISC